MWWLLIGAVALVRFVCLWFGGLFRVDCLIVVLLLWFCAYVLDCLCLCGCCWWFAL